MAIRHPTPTSMQSPQRVKLLFTIDQYMMESNNTVVVSGGTKPAHGARSPLGHGDRSNNGYQKGGVTPDWKAAASVTMASIGEEDQTRGKLHPHMSACA